MSGWQRRAPRPLDHLTAAQLLESKVFDDSATVLTEYNGLLHWASTAVRAILAEGHCLTLSQGGLLCGRTRHSEILLRQALADASKGGTIDQLVGSDPGEEPDLFLRARPAMTGGAQVLALTIKRLHRRLEGFPDLSRLYGLTNTEQQIIRSMIQGECVTEIANELGKSVLTVRTHVKRIYLKLKVGTKEQLFSTVMNLMVG
jgi:DNA-binding CsgD family transcriptional regulator